jgi:leader peptidase (prepilin peptidase)/N-methyltransferase
VPLLAALAVVVVLDLRSRIIPDLLTLPGLAYALLVAAALPTQPTLPEALLGALVGGGIALLLAIVSRGALGGGDIKLLAMLGAALGWGSAQPLLGQPVVVAFVLSQLAGGAIALALLLTRRAGRKSHLQVGALIALFGALLLSLGE